MGPRAPGQRMPSMLASSTQPVRTRRPVLMRRSLSISMISVAQYGLDLWCVAQKLGARKRLTELCALAITQRHLSLWGRCLRSAMSALIARQYWEPCEEVADGSNQHEALLYIIAAVGNMPDRGVLLTRPDLPPILIYTDASASLDLVRLGAKIVLPNGSVHITIHDPPQKVMASWGRQT